MTFQVTPTAPKRFLKTRLLLSVGVGLFVFSPDETSTCTKAMPRPPSGFCGDKSEVVSPGSEDESGPG